MEAHVDPKSWSCYPFLDFAGYHSSDDDDPRGAQDLLLLTADHWETSFWGRLDMTIDDNLPNRSSTALSRSAHQPRTDPDRLSSLPFEIVQEIISLLDLQTIKALRLVNSLTNDLVCSNPDVVMLSKHVPNVLQALHAVRFDQHVICKDLVRLLGRRECTSCWRVGRYLYILTLQRVRFDCLTMKRGAFNPVPLQNVRRREQLNDDQTAALLKLHVPRGRYSPWVYTPSENETLLVDGDTASEHAMTLRPSTSYLTPSTEYRIPSRKCPFPLAATAVGVHHDSLMQRHVFMAVVHLPYLNDSRTGVEWGQYCRGCAAEQTRRDLNARIVYDEPSYKKHLRKHGPLHGPSHGAESFMHDVERSVPSSIGQSHRIERYKQLRRLYLRDLRWPGVAYWVRELRRLEDERLRIMAEAERRRRAGPIVQVDAGKKRRRWWHRVSK